MWKWFSSSTEYTSQMVISLRQGLTKSYQVIMKESSNQRFKRILKLKISLNDGTKNAMIEIIAISALRKNQQSLFKMKYLFVFNVP